MTLSDDVFGNNFGTPEDADVRFERAVVKKLFTSIGKAAQYRELVEEVRQLYDTDVVQFHQFLEIYPGFPCHLTCRKVPYIHKLDLWSCLNKGKLFKTELYKVFCEEVMNVDPDRHFGLVFPVMKQTKFVMHNKPRDDERLDRVKMWPRITIPLATTKPPILLTIEPLDGFLNAIGGDWIGPDD